MAGIVFVGDLQLEFENLDIAEQALLQVSRFGKSKQAEAVVFLGDLKERYNPVDVRVLNFMLWTVEKFHSSGLRVYIILGNHDRVGLYSEKENWLPAMAKAGAKVFDSPGLVTMGRYALFMLPYRAQPRKVREAVANLVLLKRRVGERVKVLCFHLGLKEARYTDFFQSTDKLSVEDLRPQEWDYLVGGHIHFHQQVKYEKVQYAGSMFATDWGEANQEKGFLYLD